jgi:glycosyltransferase involved in cell wall biosynthesis
MPRGRLTIAGIKKLIKILRECNPDIVNTWMYHADLVGGIISRFLGFKKIVWGIVHYNIDPKINGRKTYFIIKLCALLSHFIPQKILTCSSRAGEIHVLNGYSQKKMIYIPLGYELNDFEINTDLSYNFKKKIGIEENEIILGCVARWNPEKDHQNLLNALAILQTSNTQVSCVLVGPNMDNINEELQKMIKKTLGDNNRVFTVGRVEDIPSTIYTFDILILPSLGEAFPNVVAEAMICGVPCVVTNVGDAAEIVGNTGWVVPPSDPKSLAEAIYTAIAEKTNKEKWDIRINNCRNRIIQTYSMEKMVNSYLRTWNSLV